MKRLLVTGARGFVGRHCVVQAVAAGFEVWGLGSDGAPPPELVALPVRWRSADLLAHGALERLLEEARPTHVLHAAWVTAHGSYWTSPSNLDWLALGARFFKTFRAFGGERFVSIGTCAEYDWRYGFMSETVTPEAPTTLYGRIKLAHHHALMAAAEQLGFSAATGRIFFAFGPHENASRLIPYVCRRLAEGEPAEVASGRHWRDFMFVEDVAAGFLALLDSDLGGACNVCAGAPVQLSAIVETLGRLSGRPDLVRLGARPDRADDPDMLVGANARLRSIGWSQRFSLIDGLQRTYDWCCPTRRGRR